MIKRHLAESSHTGDYDIGKMTAMMARWSESARSHFWFMIRNDLILDYVRACDPAKRMIEVGCGLGVVLNHLLDNGVQAEGMDIHISLLEEADKKNPNAIFHHADLRVLPDAMVGQYDIVGMFDVLEHFEDEDSVIAAARKLLVPHGHLILTVPAHQFLFNRIDCASGHKRRYGIDRLTALAQRNNLQLERHEHMFGLLLPLYILKAAAASFGPRYDESTLLEKHVTPPPDLINRLLFYLCVLERRGRSLCPFSWNAGSSIIATFRT